MYVGVSCCTAVSVLKQYVHILDEGLIPQVLHAD